MATRRNERLRLAVTALALGLCTGGCVIEPNPSPTQGEGGSGQFTDGGSAGAVSDGAVSDGAVSDGAAGTGAGGDTGGTSGGSITGGDTGAVADVVQPPPTDTVAPDTAEPGDISQEDAADGDALDVDVPDSEGLDGPDEGGDGVDPLLPCQETAPGAGSDTAQYQWDCPLLSLCDEVLLITDGGASTGGDVPDTFADDGTAYQCAAQKLKDREIGSLRLSRSDAIGQFSWSETVYIVDSVHALADGASFQDSPADVWIKRRQLLRPPAHFEMCLAAATDQEIFDCLLDWSAGCDELTEAAISCPDPTSDP